MEVTKKDVEGNNLKLTIEVEKEKVDEVLNKAYKKVVKEVSVPGFRKGKVPRTVLEAKYGKEVLYKDALDILIPEAYSSAISDIDEEPISRPEIEDYYFEKGEKATITAAVEIMPEVELGAYTDLGVEKEEVNVEEKEINEHLERYQQQNSRLELSDKETIEEGDIAVVDYEGTKDGEAFAGGSAEEYNLEIGSGQFIPGFEEKLIGEKVGSEINFDIDFPEDYQAEDLAGETVNFKVKINEIKEKVVPELNDDFAKDVSDFETIDELKNDLEDKIKEQKTNQINNEYENKILDEIAKTTEIEIPETLIENELENMFRNFSFSLSRQGMKVEDYFEYSGQDKETWKDENYEKALKNVRDNLILKEIAQKEEIEVSDDDIEDKIAEMAENSEMYTEEIKKHLTKQGQIENLKANLKIEKTLDFLKDNN